MLIIKKLKAKASDDSNATHPSREQCLEMGGVWDTHGFNTMHGIAQR